MTCVWDAIIKEFNLKISPLSLLSKIQSSNIKTTDVLWQGKELTKQVLQENIEWISALSSDQVLKGYYCSTCDPLLLLISQLYKVSILHIYNGHKIRYTNIHNPNKIIKFKSNNQHFW